MNIDDIPEYQEMRKGLMALRLVVEPSVADDLLSLCEKAILTVHKEGYQRGGNVTVSDSGRMVELETSRNAMRSLALGNADDAKHWKNRADDFEGVLKDIIKGNPRCQSSGQILAWVWGLALAAIAPEEKSS